MDRRDLFECKCGCRQNMIDPRVVTMHQAMEEECMVPLAVNSGYRCPKHNKAVGGSPTSSHIKGLAMDLACASSRDRYQILRAAFHQGITRIEIRETWIHVDIDRSKDQRVVWLD